MKLPGTQTTLKSIIIFLAIVSMALTSAVAYQTLFNVDQVTVAHKDPGRTPEIYKKYSTALALSPNEINALPKNDRPDLAALHDALMTQDLALGYPPSRRKVLAFEEAKRRLAVKLIPFAAIPGVSWNERGPNNIGGRTRAIMFDPNDPTQKKVWAGGVSGGLWWVADITDPNAQWHVVDDLMANLAISSIAFDPTNPSVFYLGTGEGWYNSGAGQGGGIWKSTDGGGTWTHLANTAGSDFLYVQKIVVHPTTGDVYAAVRNNSLLTGKGIMRSQDGGTSWTEVLGPSTGSASGRGADLEIGAGGTIYAALGVFDTDGVYSSATGDAGSWTKLNQGANGFPTSGFERVELATSASTAGTLYAVTQDPNFPYPVQALYKSTDSGATWTSLSLPTTGTIDRQAFYDLILAVDPNDDNGLFLGVVSLFKSPDAGTTWAELSGIHVDQHAVVYKPGSSSEAVFGNDGGVYYSSSADQAQPSVIDRNNGYNITQFYSVAMENSLNVEYFLAGAQDNGTQKFTSSGINSTSPATGGDGGYTFIDQDDPTYQITGYIRNQYWRSTDGGNTFPGAFFLGDDTRGWFINPADYDDAANILYSAGNEDELVRTSGITTTPVTDILNLDFGSGKITHIRVSPHTPNRIFVGVYGGTGGGKIFAIDNANSTTPVVTSIKGSMAAAAGNWLSSIAVGQTDAHLIATFSNYGSTTVWETSNATDASNVANTSATWVNRQGNLPDIPVRWALFNPTNFQQVLLATEVGIWSTDDITAAAGPDWQPTVAGLANVRTDMFQYRTADQLVAVATYGRGLFTTDVFLVPFADFRPERSEWLANLPLQFIDRSHTAISWAWDFESDGVVDDTTQHPQFTYGAPGTYNITLTINGDPTLTATKTVTIFPEPTLPYVNDFNVDGGGFYPSAITGGTANKWEWGAGNNKPNFNPPSYATIEGSGNWMTNLSGHHGQNTKYALETPPFSFAGNIVEASLEFKYRSASGDDAGMNLESSVDGGLTWSVLGSFGADPNAVQDWYNMDSLLGLDGQPGWHQLSFTVFNPKYLLNGFIGQGDVRFRFVFGAVGSNPSDGFQLDNFKIFAKQNQTITFPPIANRTLDGQPIPLNATASSGLQVSYTVLSGPASLLVDTLTINGPGDITVRADQSGNDLFTPAAPVERTFRVRELVDAFLVLDRSGSMSQPAAGIGETKMSRLISAANMFINLTRVDTADKLGIVKFSCLSGSPICGGPPDYVTRLSDITTTSKGLMTGAVGGLSPNGNTPIGEGLGLAFLELMDTSRRRVVLLLSDGKENAPRFVDPANGSPVLNIPPGIEIYTVGLGIAENMNTDVLSSLSSSAGGYFNLTQTDDLALHKFFFSNFGDIFDQAQAIDPVYNLSAGQDASVAVNIVEPDQSATFVAFWTNRASQVRVELITPTPEGDTITADTAASHGIDYVQGDLYAFYRVSFLDNDQWTGMKNGEWKVRVTADSLATGLQQETVSVSVLASSGLTFKPSFDKGAYSTGDRILVRAKILEDGQPVKADAVNVIVTLPDEGLGNILSTNTTTKKVALARQVLGADLISNNRNIKAALLRQEWGRPLVNYSSGTFSLYDDGQHGDGLANDGLWANYYDGTQKEGVYRFLVKAKVRTKRDEVTTRERNLSTDVSVSKIGAANTGIYIERIKGFRKGYVSYKITLEPKDKYGNYVGPGRVNAVRFNVSNAKTEDLSRMKSVRGATVLGPVTDSLDGKYSQIVAVPENISPDDVGISINVSRSVLTFNLGDKLKGPGDILADKWWWWLLIAALMIIALIVYLRRVGQV